MSTAALELRDVVVTAGRSTLLDGVSLDVEAGRIVVVVGANGAGKTTLLDTACGVVATSGGTVRVAGRVPVARRGIGRVFQGSPLPATLTVAEVAALATGDRGQAGALMDRFGLGSHASTFVAELSTGMRRILDLAVATVGGPSVLLLDEPASGLAQSEVDRLAELIVSWRDETGAAVVCVEHDVSLVKRIADEVVVMDVGRIVARGAYEDVLGARAAAVPRMRHPASDAFRETLAAVTDGAAPARAIAQRSVSTWRLLRIGLREFAAGMGSVLILGVLNRVMKIEMGISLGVVAAVLASYNLAAPFALAVGHRSDTHPIRGRRRVPYILGGAAITGLAVAGSPYVAFAFRDHGVNVVSVTGAVALFVAMGLGMYGSGTVFFALIADVAPESERGHAASIVYLMLAGGILAGVALTGGVLDEDATNIGTLFAIGGLLVFGLTALAVWGQELPGGMGGRRSEATSPPIQTGLFDAIRGAIAIPQARIFFAFMSAATLFLFLQQAVLEPFGGDVLGMSARQTSAFNAVQTIGVLAGMLMAGRNPIGHLRLAKGGLLFASASFAALAVSAAAGAAAPSWLSILCVGTATGVFNVATLALMMGMADDARVALFMGGWTVAHALADGAATAGGGLVYEAAKAVFGSDTGSYGAVFALEAVGLAACLPLLRRIDPARFSEQVRAAGTSAAPGTPRSASR